jgi:hypothetical protein
MSSRSRSQRGHRLRFVALTALGCFGLIALSGCESTAPELADVTGSFTATAFTTSSGGGTPIDQLAAGATVTLVLNSDHTTSGRLFAPGEDGIDASLVGTFAYDEEKAELTLQHDADTFLRDMRFEVSEDDGRVRLEGSETFSGTVVSITLESAG